ncbi:PKD domain containing protein [Allorhizocola rhizosphaerae]|uniref:PKD domain containing protein n=1 Tax=Allorhizocola rhizosphaerae TaxID=1872709 RepID=UPI000E3DB9C6|nr:PKD domain containing protein [Allorhizocola rhizosphaerae]
MRRLYLALLAGLFALSAPAAAALIPEPGWLVSDNPVGWTPHVLDGEVRALAVVGDTVVVGGDFTSVTDHAGRKKRDFSFLFAFQFGTGKVLNFSPWLDGPVLALEPGPDNTVYVGGRFRHVGDRKQRGIAQVDLATGKPVKEFAASIGWGDVRAIARSHGKLYIGGTFEDVSGIPRAGLARLDATTGAVDEFDAHLSADELGRVKVEDLAVSPNGDRMMVIGALTEVGGAYRAQAAMFDLTPEQPQLADWWTRAFDHRCRDGFDTWLRAVDFSPDGSYLVIVTTGRHSRPELLCDTAARFETYAVGETGATWVNHTGGDSLYAVEISNHAVYVGGHQRWMDNPYGDESAGPGAIDREGLAAIDPDSGLANDWNPTRKRGIGARALLLTDRGLLVGSDTDELAHEYHGRLGLFPFRSGSG